MLRRTYFRDDAAALAYLEALAWPDGPICPRCNGPARRQEINWRCRSCDKAFTVFVGTALQSLHLPPHKLMQAVFLLTAGKPVSSYHLSRTVEINYKSAIRLARRIGAKTEDHHHFASLYDHQHQIDRFRAVARSLNCHRRERQFEQEFRRIISRARQGAGSR